MREHAIMTQDRIQILKMIEAGQISTEDALLLLDALDAGKDKYLQVTVLMMTWPGKW